MRGKMAWGCLLLGLLALIPGGLDGQGTSARTYEVRNRITSPQVRSDAARAIDAYERLMDRYLDLTQANFAAFQASGQDIAQRLSRVESALDRVEGKLDRLNAALAPQVVPRTVTSSPPPGSAPATPGPQP